MNDIALLHLEENLEMQSRIDDDSNPHVAKPVKFASEGRTLRILAVDIVDYQCPRGNF